MQNSLSVLGGTVKWALVVPLVSFLTSNYAYAAIPTPTAPTNSPDGNYTVSYQTTGADPECEDFELQEKWRVNDPWVSLNDTGNGYVEFQNKLQGAYQYRVVAFCETIPSAGPDDDEEEEEEGDEYEEYSPTTTVNSGVVPTSDSIANQLAYTYLTRIGDVNGDSLNDVFITRTSGGDPGNGVLGDSFITQNPDGSFVSYEGSSAQIAAAHGWPMALTSITKTDINIDGHMDIVIGDLDYFIPGSKDQFVVSSGEFYYPAPQGVIQLTPEIEQFAEDLDGWREDPNYFDNNAVPVFVPPQTYIDIECAWIWGWDGLQFICYPVEVTIPGYSYLDYSGLSQEAIQMAELITKIINGDSLSIADAIDVLEGLLGVDVGGWDFGGLLPGGVDALLGDVYSLFFVLRSAEDIRDDTIPQCILNDPTYFPDRLDKYVEPNQFVSRVDDLTDNYNISQIIFDDSIWADDRYTFTEASAVAGFSGKFWGFIDLRHLVTGYKIAAIADGEGKALITFEALWEKGQGLFKGCGSSFIREDIVSNHIGAKAAERDQADGSIVITGGIHAEDIIEEYLGSIVSESTATAALVLNGYITP